MLDICLYIWKYRNYEGYFTNICQIFKKFLQFSNLPKSHGCHGTIDFVTLIKEDIINVWKVVYPGILLYLTVSREFIYLLILFYNLKVILSYQQTKPQVILKRTHTSFVTRVGVVIFITYREGGGLEKFKIV